jgi:hypothetical protein
VRGDLSAQEFQDLVRDIAETKLHFLTLERERVLRRPQQSGRRPGLAQAIGSIPRPQRPPISAPTRPEETELRP